MHAPIDDPTASDARIALLTFAATAAAALLFAPVLTDGDSCLYASLARDMSGASWRSWVAPQWAQDSAWTWYREHPPAAMWPAAVLGTIGFPVHAAPFVASALWMVLAAAGVAAVVWYWRPGAAPWIAAAVFLLHVPALRYVQRVALEFPIAACTAWSLAAALRLRRGRRWAVVLAAALGGAFLVRGAFGGVAAVLVAATLWHPQTRPPFLRLLVAVGAAATALVVFDRLHAAVTGDSFWAAYVAGQVSPSFIAGGTRHSAPGRQFLYFAGRLAAYSMPWALLPLWRVVRGPRWRPHATSWGLLTLGVVVTYVGASLTLRPASRYLFAAWPCMAALFALALPERIPDGVRRAARLSFVVLAPALIAGSAALARDDDWTRAAAALGALRDANRAPAEVRGPFGPRDAGDKSFLRWHLGTRAIGGDEENAATWLLYRSADDVPDGHGIRHETPFGVLVAPQR